MLEPRQRSRSGGSINTAYTRLSTEEDYENEIRLRSNRLRSLSSLDEDDEEDDDGAVTPQPNYFYHRPKIISKPQSRICMLFIFLLLCLYFFFYSFSCVRLYLYLRFKNLFCLFFSCNFILIFTSNYAC
jgi:hypothetical protein